MLAVAACAAAASAAASRAVIGTSGGSAGDTGAGDGACSPSDTAARLAAATNAWASEAVKGPMMAGGGGGATGATGRVGKKEPVGGWV